MKVFMDSEFTGLHQGTTLVSLALVSEKGDVFYAEITDYDKSQCDDWLRENVVKHLVGESGMDRLHAGFESNAEHTGKSLLFTTCAQNMLVTPLTWWLKNLGDVEIWSDCLAYDWVLFCEIFGGAMEIPENVYYIPYDLCTLMKVRGVDPEEFTGDRMGVTKGIAKHNALWDALVIKACCDQLL